ncbi:MAG: hypothetical protein KJ787_00300 [Gammaproteobacteria bacterium]|nr:hypothetical protein [Gammaproteobacteria bacterium]MBU1644757.1 hypothetical protein [Gammaproteobacteria bacterium]MBU1973491.1 hypothetical protein [Gammaproteobacteria bacterium]
MRYLLAPLAAVAATMISGCSVIAVADAAVSVGATVVSAGATVVGAAVDVTGAGVRAVTGGKDEPAK